MGLLMAILIPALSRAQINTFDGGVDLSLAASDHSNWVVALGFPALRRFAGKGYQFEPSLNRRLG